MFQVDQLSAELASERSNAQRIDGERSSLERLSKELKAKLEETESQLKTKVKMATQALESKIANLEEQLDAESRYETLRLGAHC
jgi:chromosome segregation ATPase